ncbi:collagen binding domain-containing protein [Agromyces sp. NPDC057679]|uniref:MSCRAMM family protein n=1 Tax=Agromyces sp. NPDC057679 TaxID=3346207 RepID=UPI00366EB70C
MTVRRRRSAAMIAVALLAAVLVPLGAAAPASAATLSPSGLQTGMVMNGTTTPASPPTTFNWGDFITGVQPDSSFTFTPTGTYTTTQGLQSSGVVQGAFAWDNSEATAACNVGAEPTGAPPSQNPNTNPWLPGSAKPNEKGDLCSTGYGVEIVLGADGSRHGILYGYWTRYAGNGEVSIFQHLEGPAAGRCDDVLIEFDYASSGTTARVLRWAPAAGDGCANALGAGTWQPQPGTADIDWSTGVRQEGPPLTNQPLETFGEFAIDLTTAGIFDPTECSTFEVSAMFTRTGNSPQANIQDFAEHSPDPMNLSNCGALTVTKATVPAGIVADDDFGYTISRDGGPVLPGLPPVDTIVDTIGAGETKSYPEVLAASDYRLSETQIPPPWSLQSVVCTAIPLTGGPAQQFVLDDPADTFLVSPANTTDCVITNSAAVITVVKQTEPDGATAEFEFEATGQDPFTLGDDGSLSFAVPVGEPVTITEGPADGWLPPSLNCDAEVETGERSVTVTPSAGQNITCTFTNTQLGTVIVSKEVHGVDGRTFDFTSDLPGGENFSIAAPNGDGTLYEQVFTGVAPGDYSITEVSDAEDPATRLADLSCTYGGSDHTGDVELRSIDLTVLPGETVRCFFTNSLPGSIAIVKRTVPVEFDQLFDFLFTPPDDDPTGFALNGNSTPPNEALVSFGSLEPGSYTITEPVDVDGWALDGVDCNGAEWAPSADGRGVVVDLLDTEAAVCFFTNRAEPASLSLEKSVVGVDPGFAWSFDFELVAPDGSLAGRTATDAAPLVEWGELVPGDTYTIREAGADQPGWTRGELTCEGVADLDPAAAGLQFVPEPGQAIACSVENTAATSSITVAKIAGGIASDFEWSFELSIAPVPEGEADPKTVSGTGQSGESATWSGLVPGRSYSITENVPAGWTGTVDCGGLVDEDPGEPGVQFTAPVGQELACTFINQATAGTGTLTKTSLGGDGTFEFVLTDLDHEVDPVTVSATTAGGTASIALPVIVPGVRYSFVEVDRPDWIEGALSCTITPADGSAPFVIDDLGEFSVAPGDVGDCTAQNTAPGRIVIAKAVDGADGTFDFTGDWLEPPEFTVTTSDGTGAASFDGIAPGSYTVAESDEDGYENTALTCVDGDVEGTASSVEGLVGSIELDPGETVVCTFTNVEWGVIVVDKTTVPSGSPQEFAFEWGAAGEAGDGFTLSDASPPFSTAPLAPGEYVVTELETDGWELAGITCTGATGGAVIEGASAVVDLGLGETVVCTFANEQTVPPGPTPGPTPPPGPAALPESGFDGTPPLLVAFAVLMLGAAAVVLARRRARRMRVRADD